MFEHVAAGAVRRPFRVLVPVLLAAVVGVLVAGARLELRTSNLDLIDPDLPEVREFTDFAATFGTPNVLMVVLEGDDPAALREGVDRLGPALATGPGVGRVMDRLPWPPETVEDLGYEPYLVSHDGTMAFVVVQPADPRSDVISLEPFVAGVRQRIAEARLDSIGVSAGLTGMPAYALDDRDVVQREVGIQSLVSLVLVCVLFVEAFLSFRRPLLAALALVVGVALTLGLITVYPGHVTLLSAFFAAILVGLGIDYGIHIVARVEELVDAGMPEPEAIPTAVRDLGPSLATSAGTTACVFAAMNLSGFRGFAELGTVAAIGVVACLLSSVTVLPALLGLGANRGPARRRARERRFDIGRILAALPSGALPAIVAILALAGFLARPGFDVDYLALQPRGSEAARLERAMIAGSDLAPSFAAFTVGSREEARTLSDRLLDEETVADVRSIVDLDELAALTGTPPPPEMLRAFASPAGSFAVYAYPAGDIWDADFQRRFVEAMRGLDPEVTGMPLLGRFMVERSRRALTRGAIAGLIVLAVWLAVTFRRPVTAILAGLPAVLTVGAMLGVMTLLGLPFNPLNVMALPVVLGIAVDDGVLITHRFLQERGDRSRTLLGTGRSVVLTSATTLAAFGTLGFASHRGLASFAWLVVIGVGSALVLTVTVLPGLLARFSLDAASRPSAPGRVARRPILGLALPMLLAVPAGLTAASSPEPGLGQGTPAHAERWLGRDADVLLEHAWLPSPRNVQGEFRLLDRHGARCAQTLLYTRSLRRALKRIRNEERRAWKPDQPEHTDSLRYLEALDRAAAEVLPPPGERDDGLQQLAIEFVLADDVALIAIYALEIAEGRDGPAEIAAMRPLEVREVGKGYMSRSIELMREAALRPDRIEEP